MKNKKLLYILVPLSLLIWGFIFYRVFAGLKNNGASTIEGAIFKLSTDSSTRDSFKLIANYRDPFLTGNVKVEKPQPMTSSIANRQSISVTPPPPPNVQYFGIISNANTKSKVGLVKISGRDFLLKEGEVTEPQIKVVKLFKDSVILFHQKFKHTIKRS